MTTKNMKVYEVWFGSMEKDGDYPRMTSKVVLSETAYDAMVSAEGLLTTKEKKTYYAEEVRLITTLD